MRRIGSLILIKNLIKDKYVASISPSSRFLIKKIFKRIDFNGDLLVVEYGAGTGVITKALLKKMSKNSKLIAIEKNKVLFNLLQNFKDDRLRLINEDVSDIARVANLINKRKADYVISGIPFSMLKPNEIEKIIKWTNNILSKNGKFILYQVSILMKKYLIKSFKRVKIGFESRNIPPFFILEAQK